MNDMYMSGYIFEVLFGGGIVLSFSKVSNLSGELEYEAVGDGGYNDKMLFFNKPRRKPDTIIFERGVRVEDSEDLVLLIEGTKIHNITILVKKDGVSETMFWIESGIITKKSFSDLDAMNSSLFIRTLELAHTGLIEIM